MPGREEILKGLECCSESISNACPMECPFWDECMAKDDGSNMYSVMQAALEFLKEQEPVSPKKDYDLNELNMLIDVYYCGNCGEKIIGKGKYCSSCGKAVKWDDT